LIELESSIGSVLLPDTHIMSLSPNLLNRIDSNINITNMVCFQISHLVQFLFEITKEGENVERISRNE
jgi:hypothetical protein